MAESPSLRWRKPPPPQPGTKRQRTLEEYAVSTPDAPPEATRPRLPLDPTRSVVISLFDADGSALAPWAAAGYMCIAVQHEPNPLKWTRQSASPRGAVRRLRYALNADAFSTDMAAHNYPWLEGCASHVAFACASPPSRDLSVAGARHWKRKREKNPRFQEDAAALVKRIRDMFETWDCPYYISNPATSQLRKLWRAPNHTYQPFEYGGWLAPTDAHPRYPEHIPNQDAYSQAQGLWTGGRFRMPAGKPVEPVWKYFTSTSRRGPLGARQRRMSPILYHSWGARTARATTPRGFAHALYERLHSESV